MVGRLATTFDYTWARACGRYKGLAWLFLGVANKDALLYDDEWQASLAKHPDNFRVDYALSREGPKNKQGGKMYIQDKVEEYKDEVFERMDKGAHMCVGGGALIVDSW